MTVSHDERLALADLLLSLGPDRPTLCEGWTTRDLAVHLVLREYRPDAMAGMFLPLLGGHLETLSRRYREKDYKDLVELYRAGPPVWNPMRLGDRFINLGENFVHHEDARRGGGEWSPRDLPQPTRDTLWAAVRQISRGLIRSSGVAVTLVRTDGRGESVTVGDSTPGVTVTGEAGELLLWIYGRIKDCDVTVEGDEEDVRRVSL
ncbi:TIGR03085 family metal-binding protein [Corynebacterium sp.]|uniref:TIGR03085 family metal-binding protein n=1 Tax=Corynebacterium sp. TaxID=1720 RepID=UPI0025C424C7|nr:TIGR03085 family metal-binding protein [Corynebacterium sp.]